MDLDVKTRPRIKTHLDAVGSFIRFSLLLFFFVGLAATYIHVL